MLLGNADKDNVEVFVQADRRIMGMGKPGYKGRINQNEVYVNRLPETYALETQVKIQSEKIVVCILYEIKWRNTGSAKSTQG